ncbi:NPCBM/NEW2 domain-containing protein [Pseudoalteromonas tunicata]|uniref:NPCBM/NEW2 domain-containing protein n=1 Tax=Pseudoalteromonas tunicata TaxID=314281 RepID=UPI00273DC32D|nr:NPCBM/NEW2 domain-containing protein [Pseudoalteromonas tunicata]MDP4983420.1 NPCBM/NEW2 domain-containing protein [Pseudoalteromonas tunicata]
MNHFLLRKSALMLALLPAVYSVCVQAKPLGQIHAITQQKNQFDLQTKDKERVQIDFLRDDIVRIWAGQEKLLPVNNKAASIVVQSDFGQVAVKQSDFSDYTLLSTSKMALRVYHQPLRFELYRPDNKTAIWQEVKPIELTEKSSYQTLTTHKDEYFMGGGQQNGSIQFKGDILDISYSGGWEEGDRPSPAPFYMSSEGYGVLRNTWSNGQYDFRSDEYLTAEHQENRFDAYYFVGDTIADVLDAYTDVSGKAPLIPRWAFEYGDADCYNDGDNVKKPGTVPDGWSDGPTGTTPDVIESVAKKYREYDMPGGWILPNDGYGCGYTNLPEVVAGLKALGFRTGLWTEDGVDKIAWEVGEAGSRAQKLDVAWTGEGYQFALDANQSAAQGILDNSDSRPFLWTVMGWAGIQRYAVTWTGDQSGSWDYIRWHVSTLIGSGLSGQVYATGDVDGIFGGSPETYMRDLQWKAFTPVLMGMSGWSKAARKHPWWFDEPYRSINRKYLKLKMRLTPYMYTLAHQAEQSAAPIVRGLMWDHPNDPHAFSEQYKNQFFLGESLLVAPVFRSQAGSNGWREDVYLPQGQWIDYWDGTVTDAPKEGLEMDYPVTLDKLPILVKAGAILPMYPEALYDGQVAKDTLTLDIYPFGQSSFEIYEDDGNTRQYQQGAFSKQLIKVVAPQNKAGDITVNIGAVQGQYQGMETERVYQLQLHTRVLPDNVELDGKPLTQVSTQTAFEQGQNVWFYDAQTQFGVVHVKTKKVAVNQQYNVTLRVNDGLTLAATPAYPAMPDYGNAISADSLLILNRPLEEPGHPMENAFDNNPDTWFRTIRDQSLKTGPHEFVLALGERRMIEGFEIAPRNDKHWKYSQVKDFEVYLSDVNGKWGEPIATGSLARVQESQKVTFDAKPGSLLRFRIVSTHDQGTFVTANKDNKPSGEAFNAFIPMQVTPIAIGEFKLLEQPLPKREKQRVYLSAASWDTATTESKKGVQKDTAWHPSKTNSMKMNGLVFNKGLGVDGASQIDYTLSGHWQTFRADVGIDDSCQAGAKVNFQVYADNTLLFDSGEITPPAVVKPELDIRGVKLLSLRTYSQEPKEQVTCANWANAQVIGFKGDKVGQ